MRKRIGLVVGEQDNDYSYTLVSNIRKVAAELDYDVFVFANYGTYDHNLLLYGEGESSVYKIPVLDTFDGFIIDETLFNIEGMAKDVYDYFNKNAKCPIAYLKGRSERFHDLMLSDRDAIKEITNHFIKEHGFTDIVHLTGRWELQDAKNRYNGYADAMLEAGLNPDGDGMIYYGDYWTNKCGEAVAYYIKKRNGKLPQAIVCANDYMAVGVIEELQKLGYKVPDDICVSGFDNEEDSRFHKITTLDANVAEFGRTAMTTLHKAILGEEVPKEVFIPTKLILRNSCGCGNCQDYNALELRLRKLNRHYFGIDMSVFMYNGYQMSFEIDEIFTNADKFFKYNFCSHAYICLCDDALNATNRPAELINEYTYEMVLKRIFYRDRTKNYDSPEITFERRYLLPPEMLDTEEPGLYFINPIHAQNKCYGYMVSLYDADEWPYHFTQPFVTALGTALDDYNVHNKYMGLEEIKAMYLKDTLTGLSNRRGFEQAMQLILDRSRRHMVHVSVASIDMDGLKMINDNYGHSSGDVCLKALARALASVVTEEETVARYGGDEFGALLISSDPERHTHFESDLYEAIERENAKMNGPYKLHASVGVTYAGTGNISTLVTHFQRADKLMYANKQAYKLSLAEKNKN